MKSEAFLCVSINSLLRHKNASYFFRILQKLCCMSLVLTKSSSELVPILHSENL